MSRTYTEEELNDPHLFDNICETEKLESYHRALSLTSECVESDPFNIKLYRKATKNKKVSKIKFTTFES